MRQYPSNSRKVIVSDVVNNKTYNASDFWAAAVMANRLNNGYVKSVVMANQEPNLILALKVLDHDPRLISDDDRKVAEDVRNYYRSLTFKILRGKNVNPYEKAVMDLVDQETITTGRDINIIISSINSAVKNIEKLSTERKIKNASGGFVGEVGKRVELSIVVVKCVYSDYRKYYNSRQQRSMGTYYVTGITKDDQAVVFSSRQSVELNTVLKIKGRVKSHRDIENVTLLNYTTIMSVDDPNVENSNPHE